MAEIKFHYLNALPQNPNSKELYFIKDTSNDKGKLYRGSQLIAETSAAEIESLANSVATALEAIQQGYETKTDATAKLTEAKQYTNDEINSVNTEIQNIKNNLKGGAYKDIDSSLSASSTNPVENQAIANWLTDNVKNYRLRFSENSNGEIYSYLENSNINPLATDLPTPEGNGYVINYLENHNGEPGYFGVIWDNITEIPSASTSKQGIVKLSDATNSTSTSLAATANAVKKAYDLANKTNVDKGSATQPVYFEEGIPVAINYTIEKSVPSDAKFTDTTYTEATTSKDGLMSAADKIKVDSISTTYETKADAATKLSEVKQYTDDAKEASIQHTDDMINAIIGEGAVETLDTIGEISQAIEENQDILDTLNEIIGKKANQTDLTNHINDEIVHITANERDLWNNTLENAKKYTNETLTNYYTKTQIDSLNLITVDEIDAICGAQIAMASEVMF